MIIDFLNLLDTKYICSDVYMKIIYKCLKLDVKDNLHLGMHHPFGRELWFNNIERKNPFIGRMTFSLNVTNIIQT